MDLSADEQMKVLKARIRNLERALAESEALSLEQIECTHRLENQLFESQGQIEVREQALSNCLQEQKQLSLRPSQESHQLQAQHIQELQSLIWNLERRPTVEHFQILQQQLSTSQTEIDMLKSELERRVDPARFYQLQQELLELKDYSNLLGDYAVRLPQVQLQFAQSQIHAQEVEAQLKQLQEEMMSLEERPSWDEVEAQLDTVQEQAMLSVQTEYESICQTLRTQITTLQQQVESAASDPMREQALQQEIGQLQQQLIQHQAERAALQQTLAERPLPSAITQLREEIQHLKTQAVNAQQKHAQELSERPTFEEVNTLCRSIEDLKAELSYAQSDQAQISELNQTIQQLESQLNTVDHHRETLQVQLSTLQSQLTQSQTQLITLESQLTIAQADQQKANLLTQTVDELQAELATLKLERSALKEELNQRPGLLELQELKRKQELSEAHHLVGQRQIEKLLRQVEELKAECVQAHAYGQTQEKEVALLEDQKRDLEYRLASRSEVPSRPPQVVPATPLSTLISRIPTSNGSVAPARPEIQPISATLPIPPRQTAVSKPARGIPPLTLDPTIPGNSDPGIKSGLLASATQGAYRPKRIDLPTFVQQRRP